MEWPRYTNEVVSVTDPAARPLRHVSVEAMIGQVAELALNPKIATRPRVNFDRKPHKSNKFRSCHFTHEIRFWEDHGRNWQLIARYRKHTEEASHA